MSLHTLLRHPYGNLFFCVISFLHFSLFPFSYCFALSGTNNFSLFFLIFPPGLPDYFPFLWLVGLARNSSTILNRSGESRHSCFVLDLREKAFSVSLLSIMVVISFSWMLSITNFLEVFFFFTSGIDVGFYFSPSFEVNMVSCNDWFWNVEPTVYSK